MPTPTLRARPHASAGIPACAATSRAHRSVRARLISRSDESRAHGRSPAGVASGDSSALAATNNAPGSVRAHDPHPHRRGADVEAIDRVPVDRRRDGRSAPPATSWSAVGCGSPTTHSSHGEVSPLGRCHGVQRRVRRRRGKAARTRRVACIGGAAPEIRTSPCAHDGAGEAQSRSLPVPRRAPARRRQVRQFPCSRGQRVRPTAGGRRDAARPTSVAATERTMPSECTIG